MKINHKLICLIALLFIWISGQAFAQPTDSLRKKIQKIIAEKNASVGIAIMGNNGQEILSVNGDRRYPMQSVFKLHIALAVISQIDKGQFSFSQKLQLEKKDLLPKLYSPLREKYPNGGSVPLSEVLEYTVSRSDNVGCDALLRLIGGPHVVDDYFRKNGFKDVAIKINEEVMQNNWDLQFQNWTTPKASNKVLAAYYRNKEKLLSKDSHGFIWKVLKGTQTGQNRLKGQLPEETIIAHKTGSSGANQDGLTAAVNDIGIIFLPDGTHFFISVFVSNSKENSNINEKIIADIAKATLDHFMTNVN